MQSRGRSSGFSVQNEGFCAGLLSLAREQSISIALGCGRRVYYFRHEVNGLFTLAKHGALALPVSCAHVVRTWLICARHVLDGHVLFGLWSSGVSSRELSGR